MYIESSSLRDSVIVKSNEIYNNTLESYYCYGAGVYNAISFLYLGDNVINSNTNIGTYCYGSAILLKNISGHIAIENNTINENTHQITNVGAATILVWDVLDPLAKLNIRNNTISYNSATGSGTYLSGTAIWLKNLGDFLVVIDGNIIKGNQGSDGSGLYAGSSFNYKLTNNVFDENDATNFGGAIFNNIASTVRDDAYFPPGKPTQEPVNLKGNGFFHPLIANNTFVENHSGKLGGAVYLASNYDSLCPVFINNIFQDNTADGMDYEIHHSGAEELLISFNNINESRIFGSWDGSGNVEEYPDFLDDTLFHIDNSSPCFNAGIDSVIHDGRWYFSPLTDYEDDPRPSYGGIDIGADEYFVVGVEKFESQSVKSRIQCFPNPFTTSTTITYELQQPSNVQITIYNHLGKQIEVIEKCQPQGKQKVVWSPGKLPAGIYYIRLQAGEQLATGKMVVVK